jgi:hypothetical protein
MDEPVISKFDRAFGGLMSGNGLPTKPTTIEIVERITGEAETYIVQTVRTEAGDNIVLKFVDKRGNMRLILPPKVANVIASQRDALTARRRSMASKMVAKNRMDRGELPGFMKQKSSSRAAAAARSEGTADGAAGHR